MNAEEWKKRLPFITALVAGQTLQSKVGEFWRDADPVFGLSFNADISNYRIKPATIKSRRYLWQVFGQPYRLGIHVEGQTSSPESWNSFVKWIDEDWVEHELPTETTS